MVNVLRLLNAKLTPRLRFVLTTCSYFTNLQQDPW